MTSMLLTERNEEVATAYPHTRPLPQRERVSSAQSFRRCRSWFDGVTATGIYMLRSVQSLSKREQDNFRF